IGGCYAFRVGQILMDSGVTMTGLPRIRVIALLGTLSGAVALSGCTSQEAASRFLVEPDRYVLYNCPDIATASQANMARQRELEGLMAKAGTSAGGQLATPTAYPPEYNQLRGEMVQLRKAAHDKNCR